MSIVYRQELGRELTWSEADNNFAELKAGVDSKKSNFDVLPVTQGGTGQTSVDAVKVAFDIATKTELADSGGAALVGYGDQTVDTALGERLPEIGTYALLRAYTGPVTAFLVRGVANIFDGGFGVFRVDAADTTTDDNGGTVLVDVIGRRWKRDYSGTANVKWWGNDAAAFQAAPDGSFVPAGTYNLSASVIGKTFVSHGGVTITGNGSANIRNLLEDWTAGFAAVDAGTYPSTSLEYKSEPSLVATTSGKVLCFYRIGPGHQGTVGDTGHLVYRVYNKESKTWGATQTLVSRAGFDSRNQVAGVTPTGRIIVAYCQCEYSAPGVIVEATRVTKYKYSDDDGLTWSAEISLSQYCAYPGLDNVPFGKLISFANGDLLITLYNYHTIFSLKSTDNGATWGHAFAGGDLPNVNSNLTTVYTTSVTSDDNITEPTLIKVSDSNLVCVGRCITTGLVSDGTVTFRFLGKRWAASTRYEVDMYCSAAGGRVYKCTVAGTSGSTNPTHTSGTATDGTVTWQYIGSFAAWASTTAYSLGAFVETYSAYLYQVAIAGTTGASAPFYSKLAGEETQIAYFKSDNGGASWGSAQYVTWTSNTYKITTSPPKAIVRGDTIDLAWYSRSPEWSLYRVRMSARGFFENPAWAFSKADGEPRSRVMRSFLAPTSTAYDWRIDVGYVDLVHLPWCEKIMAAWYDKPAVGVAGKTTLYSTIIE